MGFEPTRAEPIGLAVQRLLKPLSHLVILMKATPNLYSLEVAEWLRRWTANPMGSACVGSNLALVK